MTSPDANAAHAPPLARLLRQNRAFLVLLLCFGVMRLSFADWNPIPSGSMRPTLLEGDVVLVNRMAYDLKLPLTDHSLLRTGEPRRGEVLVFFSPVDGTRLIKRLVAVGGDLVEMHDGRLWLNGVPAPLDILQPGTEPSPGGPLPALRTNETLGGRAHALQFLTGKPALRDWGPVRVPEGQYFFLGDNRDNSADSRYFGSVPRALLVGRAHRTLVSVDMLGDWSPRFERFVAPIR